MIYFIQSSCPNRFIKIGTATNVRERLNGLRTGIPYRLKLLATMGGDSKEEKRLHEQFAALNYRGEWFRPGDKLLTFIDELVAWQNRPRLTQADLDQLEQPQVLPTQVIRFCPWVVEVLESHNA